jgi:hypothetical protein
VVSLEITPGKWVKQIWPGCCVLLGYPVLGKFSDGTARRHCSPEIKNTFKLPNFNN